MRKHTDQRLLLAAALVALMTAAGGVHAAGPPRTMTINAGTNNLSAMVNTAFANPLAVTVTDMDSNPVQGVNVTFTAPATGASGLFSNNMTVIVAITDASSVATAPFTAKAVTGFYSMSAAADGLMSVIFSLQNTPASTATSTATATATVTPRPHGARCTAPLAALAVDRGSAAR